MSASVTTLRSLQTLVEQHGGTFEIPRWTQGSPFEVITVAPPGQGDTARRTPSDFLYLKTKSAPNSPPAGRRQFLSPGVITFAAAAAGATALPHNQVFETARSFIVAADHALLAYLDERKETQIKIKAGDVEITLKGPYSAGDARRLFDEALKASSARKR